MASLFSFSYDTHAIPCHLEREFYLVSPLQLASREHLRSDPCPASFGPSLGLIGPSVDHAGRFRVDLLHDSGGHITPTIFPRSLCWLCKRPSISATKSSGSPRSLR